MSILSEINTALASSGIPIETSIFSDAAPDEYIVLTPIIDSFEVFADNLPQTEVQEVRISFFNKTNYIEKKNTLTTILINGGFTISERRYMGYDEQYHHYSIDVLKEYKYEINEED